MEKEIDEDKKMKKRFKRSKRGSNYGSHDAGTRYGSMSVFSVSSVYLAGITPEVKYMRIERSGRSA